MPCQNTEHAKHTYRTFGYIMAHEIVYIHKLSIEIRFN